MKLIYSVGLVCLFTFYSYGATKPPTYWPTDSWQTKSLGDSGFDFEKFQELVDYVFDEEEEFQSNSLVVVKDGFLVHESYREGFSSDSKHILWSVSKSLSSLIFATARKDGIIHESHDLKKYFSNLPEDKKSMKVEDVLRMSSSIDFRETYESDPTNSDVINILYLNGRDNIVDYVLKRPMKGDAGSLYSYSSGDTTLLLGALRSAVNDDDAFNELPFQKLFYPLGIKNLTLEKDRDGNFYGASSFYLTSPDLAKIGLLILNRGRWEDQQLFEESWIDIITTPAPAWIKSNPEPGKVSHSAQFWLNKAYPEYGYALPMPDTPEDIIMALGHYGQKIFILPSQNIVMVRNGLDKKASIDNNKMIKLLLEAMK